MIYHRLKKDVQLTKQSVKQERVTIMKLKKKKAIIATSVITGVCILAGSAFANYSTANGYDVFKTGVKNTVGMKNYTFEATVKVNADGEETWDLSNIEKYDANGGNPSLSQFEKTISKDGESIYQRIIRDGKRYYPTYEMDKPSEWEAHPNYDDNPGTFDMLSDDDRNTADKVIRFVELLSDAVVGDLKNNFVYGGESEYGGEKYAIALDKIQIPELINAGLSAVCALNSYDINDYEDSFYRHLEPSDPEYYMYHNSSITSVSCGFETDTEGRLADTLVTINIASEDGHTIEMAFGLKLYDIGSTVPDDIEPGAKVIDETDDDRYAETVIID